MSDQLMGQLEKLSAGELEDLLNGLTAMRNAARGYDAFGGKGSYESVKFIFKADGISSK